MNKTRLEALTDAIIAIAATIMVLELHAPEEISLQSLLELWPIFLAYLISFSLIYIVWYNHHNLFKKADIISPKTYILNGIWIFILTLVPFTTSWVGDHPDKTLPQMLYLINLFLWSIAFHLMDNQIIKDNDVEHDITTGFLNRTLLYGGTILSMVVSFFIPYVSLIIMGLIILFVMVLLFRRRTL